MVVILASFISARNERLRDEGAVLAGFDHALDWVTRTATATCSSK